MCTAAGRRDSGGRTGWSAGGYNTPSKANNTVVVFGLMMAIEWEMPSCQHYYQYNRIQSIYVYYYCTQCYQRERAVCTMRLRIYNVLLGTIYNLTRYGKSRIGQRLSLTLQQRD